jgi:TROVE domain
MKQNTKTKPVRTGVIKVKAEVENYDGFPAYQRKPKGELFLLGAGRFFGEGSYYESDSTKRFVDLVHKITKSDPEWVAGFLNWLRNSANIRTAAIVGAAEYVKAGGPNGRTVVKSVLVRGDEPAELLGYWIKTYGKNIPQPIKRGVKDRAEALYTQRNFAKWDSKSSGVRMADVVELTHPIPRSPEQNDLFRYMLEDRRGRGSFEGKALFDLKNRSECRTREAYLSELLNDNYTISWENVSSAESGPMSAEQWLALYPKMGYMAQLRNLNNLDKSGVALKDKRKIGEYLANEQNVSQSRQLPMRFYAAYKATSDDVWKSYLSEALEYSLANVPKLAGKWLVLVDASGSMFYNYSSQSDLGYYDTACVFAAALAKVNDVDVRTFSNVLSNVLPVKGKNILKIVSDLTSPKYAFGMGTNTASALSEGWKQGKYDGVIVLTDEQYNGRTGYYGTSDPAQTVPKEKPLYTFNLAGYKTGHSLEPNRITVGGLSDSAFSMIAAAENFSEKWPWE